MEKFEFMVTFALHQIQTAVKKIGYLLILICFTTQAQNHQPERLPYYPSFPQMASKFFETYSLPTTAYNNQYIFAKKPDGWHILFVDLLANKKVIDDYFFWERSSNRYQTLDLAKEQSDNKNRIPKEYDTWENNYFNTISPYFGYVGWDADVIKDYGTKENLSDSLLNALARAYTSYAVNLLGNNTGYSNPNQQFHITCGLNALTRDQLETYRKYEHLGIETYKKLWKQNPRFENFVADIYTVYSNEVMNSFLTLRYYQNEEEAHKELKPGLYDPFYLNIARNYLVSCDSNAIILTNGDSDTYPLLYVQEQEGFRKDVLVTNISLLQAPQYINHLFNKIGLSDPLSVHIDKDKYINGTMLYAYIIKRVENERGLEVKDVMEFLNSSDTATKYKTENGYLAYIPTTHFKITVNKKNALAYKVVSPCDSTIIEPVMDWSIKDNQAIYQNEIAILDILSSANFTRPVYFAITVADECYLNLEKYFQHEGFAYKIVPITYDSYENYEYARINTNSLYQKLTSKFFYVDPNNDNFMSTNKERVIINFRAIFAKLASALINENKQDSAKRLLTFCFEKFPAKKVPLNYYGIPFISCYYRLNEFTTANNMANSLIDGSTEKLEKYKQHMGEQSDEDKREVQIAKYTLIKLNELAKKYKQHELVKTTQSKLEKYTFDFN